MIAVVPVRDGVFPAGSDEAIGEAGGDAIIIGTKAEVAANDLSEFGRRFWTIETELDPLTVATNVEELLRVEGRRDSIIVPASPDGRDLAPHIAHRLGRVLYAGAISVTDSNVSVSVRGGLSIADHTPSASFVSTFQIGVRGAEPIAETTRIESRSPVNVGSSSTAVRSEGVMPPDVSTMDLAEAPRILGGGAGLSDGAAFELLGRVAVALDASMGVTRVITDRGWASHERQIGTTGVVVDPDLYVSFGVSGAVQHTSGLGQPHHIISVNTDAHCPMMQMSDLAIVSDANEVLNELATLLDVEPRS
ncbi:MAG: electron transfer flavoprotein subunit alpha/FixB family protein [Actinobacteria bacterium]|nr:electron transfer flavoprotein subunit alpha/FixB family protein [Actinomycetota bacterium]NDE81393.1 electron transfer flavoprotein subunit alpha/FixB family protein [Actinomycetota bacterium]